MLTRRTLEDIASEFAPEMGDLVKALIIRHRFLMGTVYDQMVATPTITRAALETALAAAYAAQYPTATAVNLDTALWLGVVVRAHSVETDTALVKYQTFRAWVLAHKGTRARLILQTEQAFFKSPAEAILDDYTGESPPADLSITETREANDTLPWFNFITAKEWYSATKGVRLRKRFTHAFTDDRVVITELPLEVV